MCVDNQKSKSLLDALGTKEFRDRMVTIDKFLEAGPDSFKDEAKRLGASDSDEDKEQLERFRKDMENFPYCNADPLLLCFDKMRIAADKRKKTNKLGKRPKGEALRMRLDIISNEDVLRTVFTRDVMRDILPLMHAKLRKSFLRSGALEFLDDKGSSDLTSRAPDYEPLVVDVEVDYDTEQKEVTINYANLSKHLNSLNHTRKTDDEFSYAGPTAGLYDYERQLLGSEVLLRNLLKAGALQLYSGDLHAMVHFDGSDDPAVKADEAGVEGKAVEDFVRLVNRLHDPEERSQWK